MAEERAGLFDGDESNDEENDSGGNFFAVIFFSIFLFIALEIENETFFSI